MCEIKEGDCGAAYCCFKPKSQVVGIIMDEGLKSHDVFEPMNVAILATKFFVNVVVSKLADDCPGICRGVPLMAM